MSRPKSKEVKLPVAGEYVEKRLYPRRSLRTRVIFEDEWGEGFIYFYSTDVSMGGIFFESEIPLKQGTKAFLLFSLEPTAKPLRVTAEVVRQVQEPSSPHLVGMGVRFLDLTQEALESLSRFMNQMA